jgi:hypothetical protein
MQLQNTDFVYGQFLENKVTKNGLKNSSHFSSNSTAQNPEGNGVVLLNQKLNNASFGYRVLGGQIQNKGSGTAKSIVVR